MNSAIENLLAPVSAESECGVDISYDPAYLELEKLILGKPETQFSPGEPPNWTEIHQKSLELLARSKNLRLALMLTAALTRVEGLSGFRDGVGLLKQMVEKYWPSLFPRLDPEDKNDPTERINIIATLSAPLGGSGDHLKILEGLRNCQLTDSAQFGRFSAQDIFNSRAHVKPTKEKPVPGAPEIEGAFRATDGAALAAKDACIAEALATVQGLDGLLVSLVGSGMARDFGPLTSTLGEIRKILTPYLPAGAAPPDASAGPPAGEPNAVQPSGALSGTVENRAQVVQALGMICDYYARNEPSSPVPLLLQRAMKLVEQDFLGVVAELSPETLQKIRAVMGVPGE